MKFDTKAPAILMPTSDTALRGSLRKAYIVSAAPMVPAAEKSTRYEKSVPLIKACPRIFIIVSNKNAGNDNTSSASISGTLARPIRKNGNGLGITNSIAERKKHKAPKTGASASCFLFIARESV